LVKKCPVCRRKKAEKRFFGKATGSEQRHEIHSEPEIHPQGFRPFPLLLIKNRAEVVPDSVEKALIVRFYINIPGVA